MLASHALTAAGVVPGIKVDTGAKDLALHPGEKVTEGLDGLRARLQDYAGMGARFAKWRAVFGIAGGRPGTACIGANAHALARYAARVNDTDPKNPPVKVELFQHSRVIPPPGQPIPGYEVTPMQDSIYPAATIIHPGDLVR